MGRLRSGILAEQIDEYTDWQHSQGFKSITIECDLRSLAGWADWVSERNYQDHKLAEALEDCKTELKEQKRVHYSRGPNKYSLKAAAKYIKFLQLKGILPTRPKQLTPRQTWPVLEEFFSWSRQHRGTRETTLDLYETCLKDLVAVLGDRPREYTAKSIRDFVLERAKPHSVGRAQGITVAVKAFLRYLITTGQCPASLINSVPRYHSYSLKNIPQYLKTSEVEQVIKACTATDENGLRDRAVILLLSRLGLRASDVALLTFDAIDWEGGRISVCGKGRVREWLPLPQDVGDAILKYLKEGRSAFKTESIFLKVDAPIGPITRAGVTHIVRSALLRAGIKAPINGAHVLRHSAATSMLNAGVSFSGVGSVLRHRLPKTTGQYAKVYMDLLNEVAQPWPMAEVTSC
jgi:integrase/recombinase XerD